MPGPSLFLLKPSTANAKNGQTTSLFTLWLTLQESKIQQSENVSKVSSLVVLLKPCYYNKIFLLLPLLSSHAIAPHILKVKASEHVPFCSSVEDLLNDEDDLEDDYNIDNDQEEKLLQDDGTDTCENEISENELDESEDVLNLEVEDELEEDDTEGIVSSCSCFLIRIIVLPFMAC